MRDIEIAGRDVVDNPAFVPTPVDAIVAKGRRRRRTRYTLTGAVAFVVLVGAVSAAFALETDRSATPTVTVQPASVTDVRMRAHLGLDVPPNWIPVDYGDARIYVPNSWTVRGAGCLPRSSGAVSVAGSPLELCPPGRPTNFVTLRPEAQQHELQPARTIDGYKLFALDTAHTNTYVIPDLHVTIGVDGPETGQVLETLAPSSKLVAVTYRGVVPHDWRRVTVSGVSVRVPPQWEERADPPSCTPPPDQVTLHQAHLACHGPTLIAPYGDALAFLDPEPWRTTTATNQVPVANSAIAYLDPQDDPERLVVEVPVDATHAIPLWIGLGRDGRVAAEIVGSIRGPNDAQTSVATIAGVWQPTSIAGYVGPLTNLTHPPTLTFDATRVTGSDGCNDIRDSYRLGPENAFHLVGHGHQTQIACGYAKPRGGNVPSVPTARVVGSTAFVAVTGAALTLFDAHGNALATYVRVIDSGHEKAG